MIKGFNLDKNTLIDFSNNTAQLEYINTVFDNDFKINMSNNYNEFAFFGGFICGKSFAQQLVIFLICCNYNNVRALYVRDTYSQLIDSVISQFNRDFANYGAFKYKKTDREFVFYNNSSIKCRAFDKDTNILSSEYDLIASCQTEDINEELFLQLFGRLSGNNLPKRLLFSEGNPSNTFVKKRYKDATKEELRNKNIFFIEASTYLNQKNLSPDYIKTLESTYPSNWIKRFVYSEWSSIDEMVFSEFCEDKHVIDVSLPSLNEEKAIGGDYGYRNPTAFVWVYKDYDDNYIVYDEWSASEKQPYEIAIANKKHGQLITVMDYSIKRPESDGKNLWDKFIELGLILYESNKDELRNITVINSLFKHNKLKICRNCVGLRRELLNYKWKRLKLGSDKNLPEQTINKNNHHIDALLYVIAHLEDTKSINPNAIQFEKTLEYICAEYDYDYDYNYLNY